MAGGLRELLNQQQHQAQVADFGREMWEKECREAKLQMEAFQRKLETFARQHKDKIRRDPEFRAEFNQMCLTLGVDPLQSKNGFWSKHLGIGSFYHELSIKIIRVCVGLKRKHGARIPIGEVIHEVQRLFKDPPKISENDVEVALKNLKSLGQGYSVVTDKSGVYVQTVSFDLDEVGMAVLNLAKETGFFTDADQARLRNEGGFTPEKVKTARQRLLNEGLIWVDRVEVDPTHVEEKFYVLAFFAGFA
jgi:ESCRT-II complex subunit VPS22